MAITQVPHFQKMLYDQGQLANVYLDALSIMKETIYSTVTKDILNYLRKDMIGLDGEIFSAEDVVSAELDGTSKKKEGAFYIWTSEEGKCGSISKSVAGLDFFAKEKPVKPLRRLPVPTKSNISQAPKSIGNITAISENSRAKWSKGSKQRKSDTPLYDVSKSFQRKKFSVICSASYCLSQIRFSESAAKHSISLGFVKLALEAGCEDPYELQLCYGCHNISHNRKSL